jgi:hypothetical protein
VTPKSNPTKKGSSIWQGHKILSLKGDMEGRYGDGHLYSLFSLGMDLLREHEHILTDRPIERVVVSLAPKLTVHRLQMTAWLLKYR